MARYGPDGEVQNIMSGGTPRGGRHTREALFSPRHLQSPGMIELFVLSSGQQKSANVCRYRSTCLGNIPKQSLARFPAIS